MSGKLYLCATYIGNLRRYHIQGAEHFKESGFDCETRRYQKQYSSC